MVAPPNRPTPAPAPASAEDDPYMRRMFAEEALTNSILEHVRDLTNSNEIEDYIGSLLPNPTLQNILNDDFRRLSLEGNIQRGTRARVRVDLSRFASPNEMPPYASRGGRKSRRRLRRKTRRMRRSRNRRYRRKSMRR
jgi:hypothetical protein